MKYKDIIGHQVNRMLDSINDQLGHNWSNVAIQDGVPIAKIRTILEEHCKELWNSAMDEAWYAIPTTCGNCDYDCIEGACKGALDKAHL